MAQNRDQLMKKSNFVSMIVFINHHCYLKLFIPDQSRYIIKYIVNECLQ